MNAEDRKQTGSRKRNPEGVIEYVLDQVRACLDSGEHEKARTIACLKENIDLADYLTEKEKRILYEQTSGQRVSA